MCVTVGFLGLLLRIPSGPQEGRSNASGLALFRDQDRVSNMPLRLCFFMCHQQNLETDMGAWCEPSLF